MKPLISLCVGACLGMLIAGNADAQTPAPMSAPEKRALILVIRDLTGIGGFKVTNEIKDSNLTDVLRAVINNDKRLSESQKDALKPALNDAIARFEKAVNEFLTDDALSTRLFEDVFVGLYERNFNEAELKELVTFYRTPTGKKAAALSLRFFDDLNKAFTDAWTERLKQLIDTKLKEESDVLKKRVDEVKRVPPAAGEKGAAVIRAASQHSPAFR